MASASAIEWTDATWNPVTGCSRVSPGCAHCYALELAPRLRAMAEARFNAATAVGEEPPQLKWLDVRDGGAGSGPAFGVTLHPHELELPLRWRKPRRVFVNSMSDLFHEEVPDDFIARVFAVMAGASRHAFQVLTKRPDRMRELLSDPAFWMAVRIIAARGVAGWKFGVPHARLDTPLPNVWLGVSIENRRFVGRADVLRETPAAVRFISAEPLLGPLLPDADHYVDDEHLLYDIGDFPLHAWRPWADGYQGPALNLDEIDWLIVGGESGPRQRPLDPGWVRALRDYCQDECWQGEREGETAFFFKQWGGRTPKAGGRLLDGRTWDEMPTDMGAR